MLTQRIARLRASCRPLRRKVAKLTRARLTVQSLERRAVPSATASVYVDEPRDFIFALCTFRHDEPSTDDRWNVALDSRDSHGETVSADAMTFAACTALTFGTAAIIPYDREEDAHWQPFHGARVK